MALIRSAAGLLLAALVSLPAVAGEPPEPASALHPARAALPKAISSGSGVIEGHVYDAESGLALAGARVQLHSHSSVSGISIRTDANGRYRFDLLAPGRYSIVAPGTVYEVPIYQAQAYPLQPCHGSCLAHQYLTERYLTLRDGQQFANIDFELEAGVRISGTITTDEATPMEFVHVIVYRTDDRAWVASEVFYEFVDNEFIPASSISFDIGGMPPGDYFLAVRPRAPFGASYVFAPRNAVDASCGFGACMTDQHRISLPATGAHLQLALPVTTAQASTPRLLTSDPLNSVTADLYSASGALLGWWQYAGGAFVERYALQLPDDYRVVLRQFRRSSDPSRPSHQTQLFDGIDCGLAPCPLAQGSVPAMGAVVQMTPAAVIRGQIRDAVLDLPLTGVSVELRRACPTVDGSPPERCGEVVASAVSEFLGDYALLGVPDGDYVLGTANRYGLADQRWPGIACGKHCSISDGTPITVDGAADLSGYDFELSGMPFSSGFEAQ